MTAIYVQSDTVIGRLADIFSTARKAQNVVNNYAQKNSENARTTFQKMQNAL